MFRIKYTYYDAGYYHRQFWSMLDEKTAPAIAKVPPLAALALRRARSGRAPADAAPDSGSTPRRLLGGGTPVLGALVAVAAGFILTAAVLAAAAGRGAALHLA